MRAENCRLTVDLFTLSGAIGVVAAPATSPFPQMVQIASFRAPIAYALVNALLNSTQESAGTTGVFLVLNNAPNLSVSQNVGILASQIGRRAGVGVVVSDEKWIDWQNHGVVIPQGMAISLYASFPTFGDRIFASANLQLKAIE